MTQEFEVTAEELVRTLQRRGIPLPSEIGAFVVLEACERLIGRPTLITTRDIYITESGDVECEERVRADSESAAVSALLSVLAELLVCAAPGVPSMLLDLVEHGPNEARLNMALLRSDLEACLLPLNRGAQRRVLSRLVREVRKNVPGAASQAASAEVGDVDATFDDLLGDTSPPPSAATARPRARSDSASESPRGIAGELPRRAVGELPRGVSSSRPAERAQASSEVVERSAPLTINEEVTRHHEVTADERGRARRIRTPAEERRSAPDAQDFSETGASRRLPRAARQTDLSRADFEGSHSGGRSQLDRTGSGGGQSSGAQRRRPRSGAAAERGEPSSRAPSQAERDRRVAPADAARMYRPSERPSAGPRARAPVDLDALVENNGARGRIGLWVFLGSTFAAVAMLLGYFALGREQSQSALGFLKPNAGDGVAAVQPVQLPRRTYGDLRVNSQPDRAQVLLLLGPGPALATDIPLGVAQEFIAMASGHRPARALLPADAVWDELDGQPRYELAIQARPFNEARKPHSADALGPTLLPQHVGAPTGRLGSVRVVTTPRAAEVYQLIGFTPDVHVDNLPLDHAYELLVYAEGHASVRKRVEPSDFLEQNGKRVARIDVQLPAAKY